MALSIRVDGLDAHGVALISPTQPEFDGLARPLLGERIADLGLRLKPMLVIVSNESDRLIVSMSLVWTVTHRDGLTTTCWGHTSFPEVICGDVLPSQDPVGLEPRQQRIEANGLVIHGWGQLDGYYDQYLPHFVDEKEMLLADAVDLHVALNAVIFADGLLVGPDEHSRLSDLFAAYVQAKRGLYRGLIEALDAGHSVAESFAPIERFLERVTDPMQAESHAALRSKDGWMHQQAAAEARSWRRRCPEADIHLALKQAIRLDPFTIRRCLAPE